MHQLVEQRQLDRLSKETRYSSARLSRRLAATRVREEGEPDNASYLRRKILQGKSLH